MRKRYMDGRVHARRPDKGTLRSVDGEMVNGDKKARDKSGEGAS